MDWLIATMNSLADAIAHLVSVVPIQAWAMALALILSALVTQRFKFWLPDFGHPMLRTLATQAIAFWTALIVTWAMWRTLAGLLTGACIGIASPTLYAIFVRVVGVKYPDIRELLSKDDAAK